MLKLLHVPMMFLYLALVIHQVSSFLMIQQPPQKIRSYRATRRPPVSIPPPLLATTTTTILKAFAAGSISEWRDLMFDDPGTSTGTNTKDRRLLGTEQQGEAPLRPINILPFSYDEVLLQGETKQLRLYEERFLQLFEHTMSQHCGVVAMGLLSSSGLVKKVALCEMEAYHRMKGFGIFVTVRVVGRADVIQLTQQEPYLAAICREISDTLPPNLELPNLLAMNIAESIQTISNMEQRLEQAKRQEKKGGGTNPRGLDRAQLVREV